MTSNPAIYFSRWFYFPEAKITIKSSFKGYDFLILQPNQEEVPYEDRRYIQMFIWWSTMSTTHRYFNMIYRDGDIYEIFEELFSITNALSLLLGTYYFNLTSTDVYLLNPGAMSHNRSIIEPDEYKWVIVGDELNVSNEEFSLLMDRINLLNEEDQGYFNSATHLIKSAKKKFFQGENSGSITEAIAAVEAIYIRPRGEKNIYDVADSRFSLNGHNMEDKLEEILLNNWCPESLLSSFAPRVYAIRAGHLHGGKISFHKGSMPRMNDSDILAFILQCQKTILNSLDIFIRS